MRVRKPPHDTRIKGPRRGCGTMHKGIVVHTTEGDQRSGPSDRHGVIDYLAGKGISVKWVTDDDGITLMVPMNCIDVGDACGLEEQIGIEQVGRAGWARSTWLKSHRGTIRNTAKVVAYELHRMGLPVTKKTLRKFVIGHDEDHRWGGCSDHWDPGPGYPWDVLHKDAMAWAVQLGYRVVLTREDKKRIRHYRDLKSAWAWIRGNARRGWNVALRRKRYAGDFDKWADDREGKGGRKR